MRAQLAQAKVKKDAAKAPVPEIPRPKGSAGNGFNLRKEMGLTGSDDVVFVMISALSAYYTYTGRYRLLSLVLTTSYIGMLLTLACILGSSSYIASFRCIAGRVGRVVTISLISVPHRPLRLDHLLASLPCS